MSAEVTLTLNDTLFERARLWAQHSGRPVDEFLAEALELTLSPLGDAPHRPDMWSDDEVLSRCEANLGQSDDLRLSELLDRQRECQLSQAESAELKRLMTIYQEMLLRKAVALPEAVRRGLREPPPS